MDQSLAINLNNYLREPFDNTATCNVNMPLL